MRTTIAKTEKELARERQKKIVVPTKELNYSQALKQAKKLLGPNARLWHNHRNQVELGLESAKQKTVLFVGNSFTEVIKKAKESKK